MAHEHEPQQGYWGSLTSVERAALAAAGSRSTCAAGTVLLTQRDTSGDVMILWSGFTKVVMRVGDGRDLVLALRGPGDIVGELSYIAGGERSAEVTALGAVEAMRIPRDDFTKFLDRFAHAGDVLQRTVVDRLHEADRDRLAAASMTVGQRLARLLLSLVERYGILDSRGAVTVRLLSQKDLAACIGGAHRSVTREMGLWRDRGIISTTKLSVTVHQPDSLARIAGRNAPPA